MTLPIESVLPDVKQTLRTRSNAVLVAPPGAGKTTRVPLALLDEPWLAGQRILMLEPRRLAARSAARFMAASLGEKVGETVGYRVRMDTRVGPRTRIEVVTEGVLTRLLQSDPALEGVGIVLFDEFHERSLHADLGLALCLQSQAVLREDLRLLVMSATLDAEPVAALMGNAPILTSEGRSHPVETRYLQRSVAGKEEEAVVRTVVEALNHDAGDLLVFLPGTAEIGRVEERLRALDLGRNILIAPLHGNLPQEQQNRAISPAVPGQRKIVLATSIAETSLTVEGVQIVVDAGLMRVPRFSPRTGMTRLETVRVSRAAADQRRGRAGRLGPGVCYRLWTEQEERQLVPHTRPEILDADLSPLALELAVWGVSEPSELLWLDPPPLAAFQQARELLRQLAAIDEDGRVTPHGRRMAELGLHPRLAHMILQAIPLGKGGLACELAAVLSERDFLRTRQASPEADISSRVEILRAGGNGTKTADVVDLALCRRILSHASQWKQALGILPEEESAVPDCGLLLAFAYPERIAQAKGGGRFLLRNGRGAVLPGDQPLAHTPFLVAAQVDDQGADSRMFLAAPVEWQELEPFFAEQMQVETQVAWDRAAQAVRARKRVRLGALVIQDVPLSNPDPDETVRALLSGITQEGLKLLPWNKTARQLQQRLQFMHRHEAGWPDRSDEALLATMTEWLAPHLYGLRSASDLQQLRLADILTASLTWEQRRELDAHAPTHLEVPSGSRIPVDYSNPDMPVLAVRLQELFGWKETPRIAGGRVPLTLHLLSPAHRPVQVTQDLASFWQNAYFEVKKDLKGRYPKHYWPDDPLRALPTNRTRPREQGNR